MRKRKNGNTCGWVAVTIGGIILMALILPSWFWWLVCGGLLIWGGIWLLRC